MSARAPAAATPAAPAGSVGPDAPDTPAGAPLQPPSAPPSGSPAASPPRRRVQAGRKASLAFAANVASAALGYAVLLLIGRYLEPDAYGSYLFAIGLVGSLAILVNLGFGSAHQRHVAQGVPLDQALGVMVRLRLASNAAFLLLVGAGYGLWVLVGGPTFTDATTSRVLGAAVVLQVLAGTRQLLLDTWTGQQRINRVEAIRFADTALALGVLGLACLVVAHLEGRWTPLPAAGAWLAGLAGLDQPLSTEETAVLLTGSYVAAKAATLALAFAWAASDRLHVGSWDRALARSYVRFGLPVALASALGLVLAYTDTLMLGYFWTNRDVGLYGVAQKLSSVASLLGATVATVLVPRFAQLHAEGRREREEQTFRQAERYLLLFTAPIAAALAALPAQGLHIAVGDAYLGAANPLRVLAATAVVAALVQPMAARFMGAGRTDLLLRSAVIGAVANAAVNVVAIPRQLMGLGATGAALSTTAAWLLSYVYLRRRTVQEYGTPWVEASHLKILAAGTAVALGWAWAAAELPASWVDRFWELALWGLVGVAAYVALLALLGEVTAKDRAFLHRVAHPRELLAELRGH